jgi:hypothetical protein
MSSFRGRADQTKAPRDSKEFSGAIVCVGLNSTFEQSLLFNVEINLRRGAVFNYLLAVQLHF